uniref:2-amino-3-ketobutyrate coenzyme A ligase, mitochondrial isoform X3 n=1 Tax=Petromyzon marinus TaxID=7757 RepID=A0AAJ7UJT1_PETMA|nr:2-amino-3-ketobutyrate coenzyme A ligase, mitochondrial isoform X3 [Petromyzon marinus]
MAASLRAVLRHRHLAAFSNGGLAGFSVSGRASGSPGALARLDDVLAAELDGIKAAGTWKGERVITSRQQAVVRIDGEEVVNFCANNYLGLSSHPEVVEAARSALLTHGAGLSSVRFICGTQDIHKQLEKQLSEFHGQEDCILYPSCFDANAGLFEALLGPDDAVFSDELNHASIIDGLRLCRARKHRYRHLDLEDLDHKLRQNHDCRLKLIATDGVFSMDGEVAPLADLGTLAQRHSALVFVDECHSTGVLGDTGRGTEELLGVGSGVVNILNSTLGKALGGAAGGYTTGTSSLVSLLRQRSRPYLCVCTLCVHCVCVHCVCTLCVCTLCVYTVCVYNVCVYTVCVHCVYTVCVQEATPQDLAH